MSSEILVTILWTKNIGQKKKNILFRVYRDADIRPKAWVKDLALGKMSIFFLNASYM